MESKKERVPAYSKGKLIKRDDGFNVSGRSCSTADSNLMGSLTVSDV
jgi:hypothetical protein